MAPRVQQGYDYDKDDKDEEGLIQSDSTRRHFVCITKQQQQQQQQQQKNTSSCHVSQVYLSATIV